MNPKTPAQLRSDDAVTLADMLTKSGVCQVDVATRTGVSKPVVQRWYDRLERHLPHVHDVRRLPKALARQILDWCAEPHGLAVVERIEATGDHASDLGHLHRILKEGADVSVAFSAWIATGGEDHAQSLRIESELRESIAAQQHTLETLVARRQLSPVRSLRRAR